MISMARSRRRDRRPGRPLPPPSVMAVIVPVLARHLSCGLCAVSSTGTWATFTASGMYPLAARPRWSSLTNRLSTLVEHMTTVDTLLQQERFDVRFDGSADVAGVRGQHAEFAHGAPTAAT